MQIVLSSNYLEFGLRPSQERRVFMKKILITIISIISFIILIGEVNKITISIILLKAVSLLWLWIVAKANNYFYQGKEE